MEPLESLQMNEKRSRTIRLSVNPRADFREVIRTLEAITLPPVRVSDEHVRFAVLELLNNSIRAHKEKGEPRDISIDLTLANGKLVVTIRDYGGGFDPAKLPYRLDEDPNALDLHSSAFEEYHRRNGELRFGMGIYIAKKTFDDFRLIFLDERDQPISWTAGKTTGTLITVSVGTRSDRSGSEAAGGK